jgi:Kef-type K+ transport system membrane component KefB/mannitol/fructose-specific phosphotransferase system IIA component (Ntr-type)
MSHFSSHEIIVIFTSLALMLGTGKLCGELFRRMRMPQVVGEILAGFILGPTVMGRLAPDFFATVFPVGARSTTAIEALVLLGVVFLLLIAGLEVDLSSVLKQGRAVMWTGACTVAIPFLAGAALPIVMPGLFKDTAGPLVLPLFMGTALAITALPVIVKILLDLKLFHSDFGMLILASAMVNDFTGWLFFSVIIQIVQTGSASAHSILGTLLLTAGLATVILTGLRYLANQALPWIQSHLEWPGGVIVIIVTTGLLLAALTEAIGIHAIFGAFLAGVAIGDSQHLRGHSREIIHQFTGNIFAPLFFVSIGLTLDLGSHFSPALTLTLTALAFTGKMLGALVGGLASGMKPRDTLPIGAAMSARGAMQVILGSLARQYGIICDETYAAIIVMAVLTTVGAGPLVRLFMKPERGMTLSSLIDRSSFVSGMTARTANECIAELAHAAAAKTGLEALDITRLVMARESLMSTGIGENIAIPHARIEGIDRPVVIAGRSREGVDFNAPDGQPAHLVFLILTPPSAHEAQIQVLARISTIFSQERVKRLALQAKGYIEFNAALHAADTAEKEP